MEEYSKDTLEGQEPEIEKEETIKEFIHRAIS
jgi:hypothetical protein